MSRVAWVCYRQAHCCCPNCDTYARHKNGLATDPIQKTNEKSAEWYIDKLESAKQVPHTDTDMDGVSWQTTSFYANINENQERSSILRGARAVREMLYASLCFSRFSLEGHQVEFTGQVIILPQLTALPCIIHAITRCLGVCCPSSHRA